MVYKSHEINTNHGNEVHDSEIKQRDREIPYNQ